jgi:peptidoglycan/LPS O-acetylase OafA/YrhL
MSFTRAFESAARGTGLSTRIPSLDGLRAISIGMVLFSHLYGTRNFNVPREVGILGDLGELGVRIFFIISGFLITSLLLDEHAATGRISLRGFYIRRMLRIFPAFYAFVLAVIVLNAVGLIPLLPGDTPYAMTFTMNYHLDRSWYVGHLWSLSVEEQFYLLWPSLLLLLNVKRGLIVAALVVLAAPLIRVAAYFVLPDQRAVHQAFPTIMDAIAVGCVLAGVRPWLATQDWYLRLIGSRLTVLLPLFVFLASSLGRVLWFDYIFGQTIMNVAVALILDRTVRHPGDLAGGVLNSAPFVFVGKLSYSLYLWQQLFLNRRSDAFIHSFPVNILLVIAVSLVSYYFLERPFFRLRSRYGSRASDEPIERPQQAAQAVPAIAGQTSIAD